MMKRNLLIFVLALFVIACASNDDMATDGDMVDGDDVVDGDEVQHFVLVYLQLKCESQIPRRILIMNYLRMALVQEI